VAGVVTRCKLVLHVPGEAASVLGILWAAWGFAERFPETENRVAAKHAHEAERIEVAQGRATIDLRGFGAERKQTFRAKGDDGG
jgi:hypothetical protein